MTTNEITWSLLPEKPLNIISKKLEDCFDVIHARSVCTSWRSILPFPSYLSRPSYSLPTLDNKGSWTLEKIPLLLFRPRALAVDYFLGGIGRDEPEEELPYPNQCSVKVEIPGSSDRRLMNMKDCQILPLGHQYRMIGCNAREYRNVAVLPLNQEGGGDFVVLLNFTRVMFVFRSAEMRWRRLQPFTDATCEELVTFRGRFNAIFVDGDVFGFDPHFLELYPLVRLERDLTCGSSTLWLDVEAGQWVVVTDIGDRVFIIGDLGNVSFSAKELPDGCGVSANSILFTYGPSNVTCSYKYDDGLNCWRFSRENLVTILSTSPVVALRVERFWYGVYIAEKKIRTNLSVVALQYKSLFQVSKLSLSPSSKMTTNEIKLSVPDWSLLPEKPLNIISEKLDDCFDVVHARSVCTSWRSIIPFPSHLSRPSYTLPTLDNKGTWSLEKIPLFLFRPRALAASEYFLGGIRRDEEPEEELPYPNQCSVKVEILGSDSRFMNMLDCQIFPLRHQYRMIGCNAKGYRGVSVLPLNKEGGGDFVVLLNCSSVLMVLRSNEMRWRRFQTLSVHPCDDLVTFRGRFNAIFVDGDVFGFDPHFLELYPLLIVSRNKDALDLMSRITLRVCRLDVDAGQWVVVKDIGDRVLVIGDLGNVSFSAKEFPNGCSVSGNSILYTNLPWNETYFYKYGVDTGREEDDLNCWRFSRENLVTILSTSPVVALRVERLLALIKSSLSFAGIRTGADEEKVISTHRDKGSTECSHVTEICFPERKREVHVEERGETEYRHKKSWLTL
ncbi:hypothetical protein Bca52824_028004 [Brassica carinata]|uniref:F-box domain-containing protein n=1 Tax=Brassica carinata TaxID=52824 RepID=A0A8X7VBN0_BRACI|nr:hypothetical protein Bca52824_028004 [Brassica carinata]